MPKKISVVIPAINEYPAVYLTLNNLQVEFSDSKYDWEVIIAENGVQDVNTPKGFTGKRALYRVPMKQGLIKYVFEPRQCGPIARNTGAREADGDYLLFCDAHTSPGKNTIDLMVDYLEETPVCGCLMGMTMKSHYYKEHGGAFYELFHQDKERERKGGPTLATHMHGSYRALRSIPKDIRYKPFPVVVSTQAYVMYRRDEFWDLGGYFEGCRFYPHPEGYMPLKVWMSGQECHTHPDSWHIHGEPCRTYFGTGPERRKKIREYGGYSAGEHGWMNVMKIAYILGEEKWINICRDALQYKHKVPQYKMDELYEEAKKIALPEREELKGKFKYTLDEVLINARMEGIAGMHNWDTRIGEDPLKVPPKKIIKRKARKRTKRKVRVAPPPALDLEVGTLFDQQITFNNKKIEVTPPQRQLHYVKWTGELDGKPFQLDLKKWALEDMRRILKGRPLDFIEIQGNWENMNIWIKNMWEALYNPPTLIVSDTGSLIGVWHGHHRLRLMDAMDADYAWCYTMTHQSGRKILPIDIQRYMKANDVAPVNGTISGVCPHCGQSARWRRETIDRVSDIKMYCRKCGEEVPYPYPGRL